MMQHNFIGLYITESSVNFEISVPGVKDAIVLSSKVGKLRPEHRYSVDIFFVKY